MSKFIVTKAGLSVGGNLMQPGETLTADQLVGANVDHLIDCGVIDFANDDLDSDESDSVDVGKLPDVLEAMVSGLTGLSETANLKLDQGAPDGAGGEDVGVESGPGLTVTDAKADIVADPVPIEDPKPAEEPKGAPKPKPKTANPSKPKSTAAKGK